MSKRTVDEVWTALEAAQVEYESFCQQHADMEAAYRLRQDKVRRLREELGTLQDSLPPCIDCGGKTAQFVGPQVSGADPQTVLGNFKIVCAARLPDTTVTLEDGTTQTIPGEKACRRIARGSSWTEAMKRWDPVGAAKL